MKSWWVMNLEEESSEDGRDCLVFTKEPIVSHNENYTEMVKRSEADSLELLAKTQTELAKKYQAALEFYASDIVYDKPTHHVMAPIQDLSKPPKTIEKQGPPIMADHGERARRALEVE